MRDNTEFNSKPESDSNQANIPDSLETNNTLSEDSNSENTTSDTVSPNTQNSVPDNIGTFAAEPTPQVQPTYGLSYAEYEQSLKKQKERKKLSTAFIPPILFFAVMIIVNFSIANSDYFDVETPVGLMLTTLLTTTVLYTITLIISSVIFKINILSPFTVVPKKPKMAFLTVLFTLGMGYLVQIIFYPVSNFLPTSDLDPAIFNNPLAFILLFIITAVLPALFEEWIYRGLLLKYLLPFGKWPAILISGIIFGLSHSSPDQAIFAMVLGIMLGIIFVNSGGSIWLTFIIHFLNNAYSVIQMYFYNHFGENSNEMTLSSIPIYIFMLVALIILIVAALKDKKAFFLPTPDETKPPYNGKEVAKFVFSSATTYIFATVSLVNMVLSIVLLSTL